ncbi:hypothetical protein O6H91_19G080000 [Diphasiastrum complanatum]|uniref:Uncharacterized protein n=1 Tax=Diphasiastrum complanatum TaxID=34168 RepID=A0ACC2AX19_DIPCM|nr:hypothetical protein O6H91_19G080000 [Diphasiastrum complanatum]
MSSRRRRRNSSAMPACIPALAAPSPCPSLANLLSPGKQRPSTATKKTDLEELKSTISSRIELLRKDVDHNYIGVIKEMEAASARLAKRTKLEVQTCLQQMDQISQEWQNFAADAHEDIQDAQGTCKELVSRIQCMGAQCNFSQIFCDSLQNQTNFVVDSFLFRPL